MSQSVLSRTNVILLVPLKVPRWLRTPTCEGRWGYSVISAVSDFGAISCISEMEAFPWLREKRSFHKNCPALTSSDLGGQMKEFSLSAENAENSVLARSPGVEIEKSQPVFM